ASQSEPLDGLVSRFTRDGHVRGTQVRLRCKSGEIRTVQTSAESITVEGRVCALITLVDLTPRVEAEASLIESEGRVRRLADAGWEGIALVDHGVMMDVNSQLASILGYEVDELVGRPVSDFVAPQSREKVRQHIERGLTDPYEHDAVRRDGTVIIVEARG